MSARAEVYAVEIVTPAEEGSTRKWLEENLRYDCQLIAFSNDNIETLRIIGQWQGAPGGEWVISGGGIGDSKESDTIYIPPKDAASIDLELHFNGVGKVDARKIDVFKDFLEMGYYNYNGAGTCYPKSKPVAHYGVDRSKIDEMLGWNCYRSVNYLSYGEQKPVALDINLSGFYLLSTTFQLSKGQTVSLPKLQRGDIIAYYRNAHSSVGEPYVLMHGQVVIDGRSTFGANNVPLKSPGYVTDVVHEWGVPTAGAWASQADEEVGLHPIKICVYRRR